MAPPSPLVVSSGGFIVVHWDLRGQAAANVLGVHIQPAGLVNQSTADAVATAVRNAFTSANGAGMQSTAVHMTGVGLRDLRQANLPEYNGTTSPTTGTDAGEPLPLSTACVVTLRTAFAGRSFRGRVYVPFDGAGSWDGAAQAYIPAATAAANGWISNIMTNLAGDPTLASNFHLAVVSRERAVANVVIAHSVRNAIQGTVRKRIPARH